MLVVLLPPRPLLLLLPLLRLLLVLLLLLVALQGAKGRAALMIEAAERARMDAEDKIAELQATVDATKARAAEKLNAVSECVSESVSECARVRGVCGCACACVFGVSACLCLRTCVRASMRVRADWCV